MRDEMFTTVFKNQVCFSHGRILRVRFCSTDGACEVRAKRPRS